MAARKVWMFPPPSTARTNTTNSIHQIVLKMEELLPMYGWEIVEGNPLDADIIAIHAGTSRDDLPIDVAHCHGLYPTAHHNEPDKQWHFGANAHVISSIHRARNVTVPSGWVADTIRREFNREPYIIPWGIDRSMWKRGAHSGYTLWNKTRPSAVCNPAPIGHLARAYPDAIFKTTFAASGDETLDNLIVTGKVPYDDMREIVSGASLYLATTKETFGIGTLEALACGVPVLGYNWGATPDIVEHGVHGYLVEPHDIDGLIEGWKWCLTHRPILKLNARARGIEDIYMWERVAEQFAHVYDVTYENKRALLNPDIPKVTVVIPVHNYDHYLSEAVWSVLHQETDFKVEVVIVDDASQDNSRQVAFDIENRYQSVINNPLMNLYTIPLDENVGVARARDRGIRSTQSAYIMCLDADDRLNSPNTLQMMVDAMEKDQSLGLVYTGLGLIQQGSDSLLVSNFPPKFDPKQLGVSNQVPTCNLFRRRAYLDAGGYQSAFIPAEDAALWLSMGMRGWKMKKITDDPIFAYRFHPKSLSSPVRERLRDEPDWKSQFTTVNMPVPSIYPPAIHSHPVRDYDRPLVSIIIPVGKGHEQMVNRAILSVQGQSDQRWELIIVNDTPYPMSLPFKYAKIINPAGVQVSKGAGAARNAGIAFAKGEFVVFLDADDKLMPDFLERTLLHHRLTGRYIYTDWYKLGEFGTNETAHGSQDYTQKAMLGGQFHPITALIPIDWVKTVGGFDESLPSWEDWDMFIRLAISGFCGEHLPVPLLCYDYDSGRRRKIGVDAGEKLLKIFDQRYGAYREGKETVCCGQKEQKIITKEVEAGSPEELVRVMLLRGGKAKMTIIGVSKRRYARAQVGDMLLIERQDALAEPDRFAMVTDDSEIKTTPLPAPPEIYEGITSASRD